MELDRPGFFQWELFKIYLQVILVSVKYDSKTLYYFIHFEQDESQHSSVLKVIIYSK